MRDEYAARRRRLMKAVGPDGLVLLPSAPRARFSASANYPYRQDSDFAYLTGFQEPDAIAVLAPGDPDSEYVLFCRPTTRHAALWDGDRAGVSGAVRKYGADRAWPIEDFERAIGHFFCGRKTVYCPLIGAFSSTVLRLMETQCHREGDLAAAPSRLVDVGELLHEMRLIKSATEIRQLKRSAQIAMTAHRRAMRACRPGLFEHQIEAEIQRVFRNENTVPAYPTIVGGGRNACVLHYSRNSDRLRDGDLLLMDAGAEYEGYASDITRTIPVNGRFSSHQRDLYEVVLEAQQAAFAKVKVGNVWDDVHGAAVQALTRGLVRLGLLEGRVPRLIQKEAYRRFYMHGTGHWLGRDVHDVGAYRINGKQRPFKPGMVITVEPGLYVRAGANVPRRWWNMGIRIEDDVVIERKGASMLSAALPRDPDGVEALMAASG